MGDTLRLVIVIAVLVYSCILHECAHVWTAWKLGDPTGRERGRLTLNPIPHIDLFWTIILPIMMWLLASFPIGGPKPAPVNPLNFRNPRAGFMWTALAGPATNLLLAAAALGILWTLHAVAPGFVHAEEDEVSFNALFFFSVMFINGILAVINLIPVPPLDGSRFLQYVLGPSSDRAIWMIERLGFLPILVAFYFLAPYALRPFQIGLNLILAKLFGIDYAWALNKAFFGL